MCCETCNYFIYKYKNTVNIEAFKIVVGINIEFVIMIMIINNS